MHWHKQIIESKIINVITILAFVVLFSSFYTESIFVFAFALTFILFSLASKWYLKHAASDLILSQTKDKIKLFPNEKDTLHIILRQYGRVPIVNSVLHLYFDNVIDCSPYSKAHTKQVVEVVIPISMAAKEEMKISIPIHALRRGFAKIRSANLTIQHPFGFGVAMLEYNQWLSQEIIIYPTPISVSGIEQLLPKKQGTYPNKHSLFEYASSPIGTRSYVASDPFNKIHWKATARTTMLQTKIYERTSQFAWSIILDIKDGNGYIENLENLLSYITYICHVATKKKIQFELFINIRSAGRTPFFHLSMGQGKEQLESALEMLARVNRNSVLIPFEKMMFFIEKNHLLAPYIITAGLLSGSESILNKLAGSNGTYQIIDHDGVGYLVPLQKKTLISI
ncbi:DUF58 domain-containing protein [Ferdinandcohnia quinoae]|uniref:DUF58 domain-containing protein n=1 Tax=Fredinandcohnia quinoae TaxID=2918902 RepID=A0AAW5E222_9BACI|nr:DUF58 domain-containing protein [Fredinandcohnia sp. SECRCQ15]MCH1626663.1 DUF58 domain-containing protein [Fredinandcohnia sp. SECRCQ15]